MLSLQGDWLQLLRRKFDRTAANLQPVQTVTKDGNGKVTGASGLKGTHVNTHEFSAAVANSFLNARPAKLRAQNAQQEADDRAALAIDNDRFFETTEPWDDAEMSVLAEKLEMPNTCMPWHPFNL